MASSDMGGGFLISGRRQRHHRPAPHMIVYDRLSLIRNQDRVQAEINMVGYEWVHVRTYEDLACLFFLGPWIWSEHCFSKLWHRSHFAPRDLLRTQRVFATTQVAQAAPHLALRAIFCLSIPNRHTSHLSISLPWNCNFSEDTESVKGQVNEVPRILLKILTFYVVHPAFR
jgi:hypothetical protein